MESQRWPMAFETRAYLWLRRRLKPGAKTAFIGLDYAAASSSPFARWPIPRAVLWFYRACALGALGSLIVRIL